MAVRRDGAPHYAARRILAAGLVVVGVRFLHTVGFIPAPVQSRRELLNGGIAGALASAVGASSSAEAYELPPLGYAYDALEPAIDKETMTIHHDKHHNTYVVNINKALEGNEQPALVELQKTAIQRGPAFRNSGGGVYNHDLFWLEMAPVGKGGFPSAKLAAAIDESFGSLDEFKAKFEAAGAPGARFGSGWVWLVVDADKKLAITSTPNQDNPLMEGVEGVPGIPILGCDVWEHAYYLKYQWQRPAYIKAWWDVVNWNQVSAWYEDALGGKAPEVDGAAAAVLVGQRRSDRVPVAPKRKGFSFDVGFNWEGKVALGGS
mmetsp:Transcript_64131/g.126874  ORF Transcript_64131/g.126874 Transcript_64131/m.126874 type:complete len:319 (-) Transcript_64131:70-1026(-)